MQWTCQLVVKTGTPPEEGVDGPSLAGRKFVSGEGDWGVLTHTGWLDKALSSS